MNIEFKQAPANVIEPERSFPIYDVRATWTFEKDGERAPNGTGWTTMLREPNEEQVRRVCGAWWGGYTKKGAALSEPRIIVTEWREEWCPTWFSHWTFDDGRSDRDCLRSFEDYVSRTLAYNALHGENARCLMGAEDRWRWTARGTGTSLIGSGESTGPAPCRCDGCRKHGVVRIDH